MLLFYAPNITLLHIYHSVDLRFKYASCLNAILQDKYKANQI